MTAPAPGVGPYRVVGNLGRGGHAVVVEAVAPDGRRVAIKQLTSARPGELARFQREGRLLQELGEGFVPLLDAGSVVSPDGVERPYLVLPLLAGGSLQDRLRRGALPVEEAVDLVIVVARALARAHARGVVHRDLKPSNILFDREGRPHVADLGLGLDPLARTDERLTRSNEVSGTPGYMAPEQLLGLRQAGPPADVFALGAILYEALAGQPAFEGDSPMMKMARVAQGTVTPLREVRRGVPPGLADAVHACLAVDPALRPADAGLLVRSLQRATASSDRGRARAGRRALGGVALLVLAAAIAALQGRGREPGLDVAPIASVTTTGAPPATEAPVATAAKGTLPAGPPALSLRKRRPPPPRIEGARIVGTWFGGQGAASLAIVEAPGGACVAAPGPDGDLVLHDLATGAVRLRLAGTGAPLVAIAASADGRLLAAADADEQLLRWSRRAGPAFGFEPAPPLASTVSAAALAFGDHVLAVAEHDGSVSAVDPEGGVRVVGTSTREGDGMAFPSPMIAASADTVIVGDRLRPIAIVLRGADIVNTMEIDVSPGWPRGVSVAAEGLTGLALGRFGSLLGWDATAGTVSRPAVLPLDPGPPRALASSGDGRVVALVFDRGVSLVRGGDLEAMSAWDLPGAMAAAVTTGGVVAVGQVDGSVSAWEVPVGAPARRLWGLPRPPAALTAILWPRPDLLLVAFARGQVGAYQVEEELRQRWSGQFEVGLARGCVVDPGRLLVITNDDQLVELRQDAVGPVDLHRRFATPVVALAGRQGFLALQAGEDLIVNESPERPADPLDPMRRVFGLRARGVAPPRALGLLVAADPSEGLKVVVGRPDGRLDVVGPAGSERLLGQHERGITAIATCAAGLVAGDEGGDVRLWTPGGDSLLLGQHPLDVQALVASPDGALVASIARDEVVAVWRPSDGAGARAIVDLEPSRDAPTCAAFSPDGRSLMLGTRAGRLLRVALGP